MASGALRRKCSDRIHPDLLLVLIVLGLFQTATAAASRVSDATHAESELQLPSTTELHRQFQHVLVSSASGVRSANGLLCE